MAAHSFVVGERPMMTSLGGGKTKKSPKRESAWLECDDNYNKLHESVLFLLDTCGGGGASVNEHMHRNADLHHKGKCRHTQ